MGRNERRVKEGTREKTNVNSGMEAEQKKTQLEQMKKRKEREKRISRKRQILQEKKGGEEKRRKNTSRSQCTHVPGEEALKSVSPSPLTSLLLWLLLGGATQPG